MIKQQRRQALISLQCLAVAALVAATTVTSFGPAVIVARDASQVTGQKRVGHHSKASSDGGTPRRNSPRQPLAPSLRVSRSEDGDVERLFPGTNAFLNATTDQGRIDTVATAASAFVGKDARNRNGGDVTDEPTTPVVDPSMRFLQEKLIQAGFLAAVALASYGVVTLVLTATMDAASSASRALGDEILHELASVGRFAVGLLVALFELVKVVLPIVGKGVLAAGRAAAPVVQETSSKIAEAATPYVQEAARSLNEAAAPYVDSVATAVDVSIVTPVLDAVDANIVAPMEDARNVVATSVDATLNGVTQTVTTTIQGVADGASNTVRDAVSVPMQGMTDSVKEATRSMRDILPF